MKETKEKKEKVVAPPSKVVIRHLPQCLTKEEFLEVCSPLPSHDWFEFYQADESLGSFGTTRAYINFTDHEEIYRFRDQFDGYVFLDQKGNESQAVVEYAPFQKVSPRDLPPKRKDLRMGTIADEPDFLEFLQKLENPEPQTVMGTEKMLEGIEAQEKEMKALVSTKTPLVEFLENRRAEMAESKQAQGKLLTAARNKKQQQQQSSKPHSANYGLMEKHKWENWEKKRQRRLERRMQKYPERYSRVYTSGGSGAVSGEEQFEEWEEDWDEEEEEQLKPAASRGGNSKQQQQRVHEDKENARPEQRGGKKEDSYQQQGGKAAQQGTRQHLTRKEQRQIQKEKREEHRARLKEERRVAKSTSDSSSKKFVTNTSSSSSYSSKHAGTKYYSDDDEFEEEGEEEFENRHETQQTESADAGNNKHNNKSRSHDSTDDDGCAKAGVTGATSKDSCPEELDERSEQSVVTAEEPMGKRYSVLKRQHAEKKRMMEIATAKTTTASAADGDELDDSEATPIEVDTGKRKQNADDDDDRDVSTANNDEVSVNAASTEHHELNDNPGLEDKDDVEIDSNIERLKSKQDSDTGTTEKINDKEEEEITGTITSINSPRKTTTKSSSEEETTTAARNDTEELQCSPEDKSFADADDHNTSAPPMAVSDDGAPRRSSRDAEDESSAGNRAGDRRNDPRTERKIRNKDRPAMQLYRPGQSRLVSRLKCDPGSSSKSDGGNNSGGSVGSGGGSVGSGGGADSSSNSPTPSPVMPPEEGGGADVEAATGGNGSGNQGAKNTASAPEKSFKRNRGAGADEKKPFSSRNSNSVNKQNTSAHRGKESQQRKKFDKAPTSSFKLKGNASKSGSGDQNMDGYHSEGGDEYTNKQPGPKHDRNGLSTKPGGGKYGNKSSSRYDTLVSSKPAKGGRLEKDYTRNQSTYGGYKNDDARTSSKAALDAAAPEKDAPAAAAAVKGKRYSRMRGSAAAAVAAAAVGGTAAAAAGNAGGTEGKPVVEIYPEQ